MIALWWWMADAGAARWWCQDLPLPIVPDGSLGAALVGIGFTPWQDAVPQLVPDAADPVPVEPGETAAGPDGRNRFVLDDPDGILGTGLLGVTLLEPGADLDEVGGVLQERLAEADVVLNDDVDWGACPGWSREVVAAHELGHVLGLVHLDEEGALMAAVPPECTAIPTAATADIEAVTALYPPEGFVHDRVTADPAVGPSPLTTTLTASGGAEPEHATWWLDGAAAIGEGNPVAVTLVEAGDRVVMAVLEGPACVREPQTVVRVEGGDAPPPPPDEPAPAGTPAETADGCGCGGAPAALLILPWWIPRRRGGGHPPAPRRRVPARAARRPPAP